MLESFSGSVDVIVDVFPHPGGSDPSGTFVISGISEGSSVLRAWFLTTSFSDEATESASATFDGYSLGTIAPDSEDFGDDRYCRLYRFDVTDYVRGDGSYSYSILGTDNIYGDALIVVYENAILPSKTIVISDGAESLMYATSSTSFGGLAAGSGRLIVFTEADNPSDTKDESITLNGHIVLGPGDIFHHDQGRAASLIDIPVTVIDGTNTLEITTSDDWFGLHLGILISDSSPLVSTLSLDASYEGSILSLDYTIGTPELARWVNYLILICPTPQVIPLWTVPLSVIDPPIDLPVAFPFPQIGWVGIWTGLITEAGAQAIDLAWVDTTCGDVDGDGYDDEACGGYDCDDSDPDVNPDADEVCDNGIDDDCDGFVDMDDPDCVEEFTLELDASYEGGILSLDYTIGTPKLAEWANYLILIYPRPQVISLWTVPLSVIDPPIDLPVAFPFPQIGWVGIWTGLLTAEGTQAVELAWVYIANDVQSNLPDTGIELCYDIDTEMECPSPGEPFYGQDAQYVTNPMSFTDHGDGTVTDNVTWLMWQQEDDDIERTWYEAIDYCEALELAGHTDWRLPDEYELQGIVDYGRFDPAIDTTYFPGTYYDGWVYYWSSSTCASYTYSAWKVSFSSGSVGYGFKSTIGFSPYDYYVRCVRGESIAQSFTDHGDGTVMDNGTGLMWQQEVDDLWRKDWEAALAYCESLDLAGHTDWRLPDVKELRSLVDNTRHDPAIDTTYFPDANSSYYWTSSTYTQSPSYAWRVLFIDGYISHHNFDKTTSDYVRCVR